MSTPFVEGPLNNPSPPPAMMAATNGDAHLYETRVTARGGRYGAVRSEDGLLALSVALPRSLGGPGGATNPEQLFAAAYAACFESA